MITQLDLADIQGNIVKAYGRYGFPVARHVFYHVTAGDGARKFVEAITPLITTSVSWRNTATTPLSVVNIAFTYQGLRRLGVPNDTLHGFPDEFSMGMKARRDIVGDTGPNHYLQWDPIWNLTEEGDSQAIHILVSLNAKTPQALENCYQAVCRILDRSSGVKQLGGHRGPGGDLLDYQPAAALVADPYKEHFGYNDGISDTFFEGCDCDKVSVIGAGKPTGKDPRTMEGWAPLKAGEFIFGHADEAGAEPEAPGPPLFSKNGTFLVYRKLHQNVASFKSWLKDEGSRFPGGEEELAAKLAGRWRNGAPLVSFPTQDLADKFTAEVKSLQTKVYQNQATPEEEKRLDELNLQFVAYDYNDDPEGARCPFGAHTRRTNPRSALMYGKKNYKGGPAFETPGALTNRRRILRRGLPYGLPTDPPNDDGDHGVIMLLLNADLSRQFEFVQQQWVNFGNDFQLANDQDPILGNQGFNESCRAEGRMVIEGDKSTGKPPYFCGRMPTLVETRGGDYFFVPSMTCLRMLALGIVDPT